MVNEPSPRRRVFLCGQVYVERSAIWAESAGWAEAAEGVYQSTVITGYFHPFPLLALPYRAEQKGENLEPLGCRLAGSGGLATREMCIRFCSGRLRHMQYRRRHQPKRRHEGPCLACPSGLSPPAGRAANDLMGWE